MQLQSRGDGHDERTATAVADVRGQRHMREQLLAEDLVAQRMLAPGITAAERRDVQVAAIELRQPQ